MDRTPLQRRRTTLPHVPHARRVHAHAAQARIPDAEGVFTLIMPNTEGGVKVLVEGQGAILGEEKANIVFGEITEVPSGPSPGEAQVAEGEE